MKALRGDIAILSKNLADLLELLMTDLNSDLTPEDLPAPGDPVFMMYN